MRISEVTRRAIIDYLLIRPLPYYGHSDPIEFLKRTWDLETMPSSDSRFRNASGDIWQHTVNNSDWTDEYLLSAYLDLPHCDDATFLRFVENCVHPVVLRNETAVAETLSVLNEALAKDGVALTKQSEISGRPVYEASELSSFASPTYDVVLSYASEQAGYVEEVAKQLKTFDGVRTFFDKEQEATLWGKDLVEFFDQIYRNSSKFCVMFISREYVDKMWPTHERRSALARAVEQQGKEYILPVRFDNTDVPGLPFTKAYVDAQKKTPAQLAQMILQKLELH